MTIRAIDGIVWIATDFSAPDRFQFGILEQTSIVHCEGLKRHRNMPCIEESGYAVVHKQEVRKLLSTLFPLPRNNDLHSIHMYKCIEQSSVTIERIARNVYDLKICDTSVYCNYASACKIAAALAQTAMDPTRIDH